MGAINNVTVIVAVISIFYWVINFQIKRMDYQFMCSDNETDENCFENPNTPKRMIDLVEAHGLSIERHYAVTEDGYILSIFRIPPKRNSKGVIFLQHPLISTSVFWVDKGNDSFAFYLHEAGYEVWLGNHRGTFSTHVNLTLDDAEYWDHSWHEMGIYDMKAQMELVNNVTNSSDIVYIGYSLGTTTSLVYASLLPEHAEKHVKVFIAFSPTAYGMNIGTGLQTIINWKIHSIMRIITGYFGVKTVSESHLLPLFRYLCYRSPTDKWCKGIADTVCGADSDAFDPKFYPLLFTTHPATAGLKTIFHYFQLWETDGIFRYYDYGEKTNELLYNSSKPPEYPLGNITVPFYLLYGTHDHIGTLDDIDKLYESLPERAKIYGRKEIEDQNHCDTFMSKKMDEVIHRYTIEFIDGVLKNKS